jgi:hypothetical protein
MKVDLGYWWPFAQTAWGWTVATAGGVAALYYGPRKMLETFDWYMDRFWDSKVEEFLKLHVTKSSFVHPGGMRSQSAQLKTVSEIMQGTGFSEKRVRVSQEIETKKDCQRRGTGLMESGCASTRPSMSLWKSPDRLTPKMQLAPRGA